MPTLTNDQLQSNGVPNHATGHIQTSSAAAAALTITVGFRPRVIRVHNITDRISDEWYRGLDELALYASIVGLNAKLDADAGITATDFGSSTNPASASLSDLYTSIRALTAKLDADASVSDTTYASLWNPDEATIAKIRASLNGIAAKLDADGGVTDTNYAAVWAVTAPSLHTVANGTRTFEIDNGILDNGDGTFTLNATTMVASKAFVWEALG
jgi:hypothetical protein